MKIDTLCLFKDEILLLFDSINIDGLNGIKNIFVDNINKIIYPIDKNFLESCRDKIIHINAFHFNRITRPDTITWEENYLLDMLNISFQDKKIIPMFPSGDSTTPNFKQWTESVLEDMQKYFDFDIADFIIETIRFILYKKVPSEKVIDKHIELFVDNSTHATTLYEKYENSSFYVISYLIEDHCMNSEEMRTIMRVLSKIKDVEELKLLNDNKISLNKDQKRILKDYYENCFLKLDSLNEQIQKDKIKANCEIDSLKGEIAKLQKDIYQLRMEKDILEKAAELIKKDQGIDINALTNKEKAIIINALRNHYPLKTLLKIMSISKSTYYYQRSVKDKNTDIKIKIKEIFQSSYQSYGYRRIKKHWKMMESSYPKRS